MKSNIERKTIKDKIKANNWSGWHLLPIFGLFILDATSNIAFFTNAYIAAAIYVLVAFIFIKIIKRSIKEKEDTAVLKASDVFKVLGIWLITLLIAVIINLVTTKLGISETPTNQKLIVGLFSDKSFFYKLVIAFGLAFITPMLEELIFRYYAMKEGALRALRIILSSVIFIMLHSGFDITAFVAYLPMTAGLVFTRLYFKSTRYSYMYHCMQNTVAAMLILGM